MDHSATSVTWIDCNAWELDFYHLPHRIPWPADADPKLAEQSPLNVETMMLGIDALGALAGEPWNSFKRAAERFEDLSEAIQDNEFPHAEKLLGEIESLHPGMIFTKFHRAHVARHDGRIDEAIALYHDALQTGSGLGFIWTNLGATLAAEGSRDEAIAAFSHAVRISQNDAHALEGLAALKAAVKMLRDPNDPKSVMYFDIPTFAKMAEQQVPKLEGNPEQLQAFAEQLLRDGFAPAAAVLALEKVVAAQPEDGRALLGLAAAYRQSGAHEKAQQTATRFTELHPQDAGGYFHLAQTFNAAGDKEKEKRALEKVLELDPNMQPALGIYFGFADCKPTEEHAKQLMAFAEARKAWMPLLIASTIVRDGGDLPGAVRLAAWAYRYAPEQEDVLLHYCALLGETKDDATLAKIIEPAVATGKYSKRLDWNFAQALRQCGNTNEAIAALVNAASAEGTPQDFQNAVGSTIDFWNGLLIEGGERLELTKGGVLSRPVLLALDDGDGAVLINSGRPIPAEVQFPWRLPVDGSSEARITVHQGQAGSARPPHSLGTFIVRGLPPPTGGAHTLQCHLIATPQGSVVFRAVLNNREHKVAWEAPMA